MHAAYVDNLFISLMSWVDLAVSGSETRVTTLLKELSLLVHYVNAT